MNERPSPPIPSPRWAKQTAPPAGYCSLVEAARILDLTVSEVYTRIGDGRLLADRIHNSRDVLYVQRSSLEQYRTRTRQR